MPIHHILGIDIATALLAILPLLFIVVPQPAPRLSQAEQPGSKISILRHLLAGFNYVWTWPGLVLILLVATLTNVLLNPGFSMLPLLVTRHFGGAALQLAWMESGWGIGVIAGGLILGVWGGFRRKIYTADGPGSFFVPAIVNIENGHPRPAQVMAFLSSPVAADGDDPIL